MRLFNAETPDKPFQIALLDIDSYMTEPKDGDEIYSFGHPLTNEFALTKGIVSRRCALSASAS